MSSVTGQAHGSPPAHWSARSAPENAATTPSASRAAVRSTLEDPRVRVRTADDGHPDHAGDREVVDEAGLAGQKLRILLARDRRADVRLLLGDCHHATAAAANCLDDVLVAGAAAEVALEAVPDLVLARIGVLGEEADGGHHHPRRAVAALEPVLLVERLLERMQRAVVGEPFDRRQLRPVRLDAEQRARLDRLAVQEHGAGAARGGVAADVRPGQTETLAQDVDEELTRLQVELVANAVDSKRDTFHGGLLVSGAESRRAYYSSLVPGATTSGSRRRPLEPLADRHGL